MLTDFQNSFTIGLSDKFAIICTYVATLPCEIRVSEKCRQICIVVNDKSQGSVSKHLGWDDLLHYEFIIQFVGEIFFEIGKHLAKLHFSIRLCSY